MAERFKPHGLGTSLDIGKTLEYTKMENEALEKHEEQQREQEIKQKKEQKEQVRAVSYKWWMLLPIALIVGALILSSTSSLHIIESFYRPQIEQALTTKVYAQVRDDYPTASEEEIALLSRQALQEELRKPSTQQAIDDLVERNKHYFLDDSGQPYLLETDAYYYFRYAENMINNGHQGTTLRDGKPYDELRRTIGLSVAPLFLSSAEFYWYRIWSFVSPSVSLLKAAFFLPVALGMLSIILLFLITYKIFKSNTIAFFASFLLAIHPYFFRQNMAGFTDTTTLITPLSIAFFFGILWVVEGKPWQRVCGLIGAALALYIFRLAWNGWFYVIPVTIACCFTLFAYLLYKERLQTKLVRNLIIALAGIGLAYFFFQKNYFYRILTKLQLSTTIPGLHQTVSELTRPTWNFFIAALGNPLFSIILLGAVLRLGMRLFDAKATTTEVFLFTWFLVMFFPATLMQRYVLFLIPSAIILVAWLLNTIYQFIVSLAIDFRIANLKVISLIFMLIVPAALGATMIDITNTPIPQMNSGTVNMGNWFKDNTPPDAIINTWWDYGYVWQYAAQRPTVIDAGPSIVSQWMAKAFMAKDETYARGIIRMLDCNGIAGYDAYRKKFGLAGVSLLDTILHQSLPEAKQTLDELGHPELLKHTHCTPPESYVLIDNHMFQVLSPIDALAAWNNEWSIIRENTLGLPEEEGIAYVQDSLDIPYADAEKKYRDAMRQEVTLLDKDVSVIQNCDELGNQTLNCWGYVVDLENVTAYRGTQKPYSLTIIDNGTRETMYGERTNLALYVFKDEDVYRSFRISPDYKDTLLIRLFVGDAPEGFELVNLVQEPERITAWRINWTEPAPAGTLQKSLRSSLLE